jgi:hypothetical protein
MSCRKDWDYKIMISKFDRKFIDIVYKCHREDVLLDRERGLMVATQPQVEIIMLNEKRQLEIAKLQLEREEISRKMFGIKNDIMYKNNTERKQFIRKCTKENCKGFLSSQWKCGMCENWTCPECHDVIGMEKTGTHICDPSTLATAKLLDNDTKTCPKCSEGIFKIDGCDMMFCVECHTSFSWITGKIETGIVHNPHYFDWLRQSGQDIERNPNEIRCGREVDNWFVRELVKRLEKYTDEKTLLYIRDCGIKILHMRYIELPRYSNNRITDNTDLRIQYMRNWLTDADFKKKLQLREKQNKKAEEYINILEMFINCQTEIFYSIFEMMELPPSSNKETIISDLQERLTESNNLRKYANECLESICKVYSKNHINRITKNFTFT